VRDLRLHSRFGLARHAFHQRFNSPFRRCQITQPINPTIRRLSAMRASFCITHLFMVGFIDLTLPTLSGSGSFFLPPAPILNFPASSYAIPFPVVDDGQLVGIVTLEDIRSAPRDTWDTRHVQQIMTPASKLVVTDPNEDAADALDKLAQSDVNQLPVVRDGKLIGLLRQRDILTWLHLQSGAHTRQTV
jgi:CBS domain-containing protein